MTLTADNSNVTLAEYRAYAAERGWDEASAATWPDAKLEPVCIEATTFINYSFSWPGEIASEAQTGPFPRVNWRDREKRLLTGTPTAVKNATIEAGHLTTAGGGRLLGGGTASPQAQLIGKKVGGSMGGVEYKWAETDATELNDQRLALVSSILASVGAVQIAGGGVTMFTAVRG